MTGQCTAAQDIGCQATSARLPAGKGLTQEQIRPIVSASCQQNTFASNCQQNTTTRNPQAAPPAHLVVTVMRQTVLPSPPSDKVVR
jgi:hypothetical protein